MIKRKIFDTKDFESIKKYVISSCSIPNADRCCLFDFMDNLLTMCFNEKLNMISICDSQSLIRTDVFELLLYASQEINVYSSYYRFYIDALEPETMCCM